ncbi:helix-turn-helix domain-containing protein [Anaerococcus kampingiae]|uniref:Helix-turn-helix domain-containing protein n=1 Tax=Anaerococcus kampingae TaxID=3115614 RepID=A0ABW9MEM6_9FIRM
MSIYKFGNDLTKIRENKRISQEDLAHLSGISRRSISRIENGLIKEPSIDTLLKLSASLDADIVDLYIKDIYESQYLYRELLSSFDILSSFKSREEILLLEKKVDILEKDHNFKGKDYELALMKLFIKSLKTPILLSLEEEFEYITSSRINKNNILSGDLTFFETRLLVNVCNANGGFKNIAKEDLLDIIISKTDNCTLKYLSYNSLINSIYVNKECKDALNLVNEAIDESKKNRFIEGNSLLYYLQFLCRYSLGDERFIQSLDHAILFSTYTGLDNLKKLIEEKSKNVIE